MVHTTLHAVTIDTDTSVTGSWQLASRWHLFHITCQSGVYPRIWRDGNLWASHCQLDWCLVMAIRPPCLQLHYTWTAWYLPGCIKQAGQSEQQWTEMVLILWCSWQIWGSHMMKFAIFQDAQQCSLANMELEICEQESSATIFMDTSLQSITIYTRLYGVTS